MGRTALPDNAAAKAAAQDILRQGLATYVEIAALSGVSRQTIRYWAVELNAEIGSRETPREAVERHVAPKQIGPKRSHPPRKICLSYSARSWRSEVRARDGHSRGPKSRAAGHRTHVYRLQNTYTSLSTKTTLITLMNFESAAPLGGRLARCLRRTEISLRSIRHDAGDRKSERATAAARGLVQQRNCEGRSERRRSALRSNTRSVTGTSCAEAARRLSHFLLKSPQSLKPRPTEPGI